MKVADVGGLLASAGIMRGDIIKGLNGVPVRDLYSLMDTVKEVNMKKGFLFDVKRSGRPIYIVVK